MNGTIYIIGVDRSETWIDGENVKIVQRSGFEVYTWGQSVNVVFKDGKVMTFENAIHVSIIDAKPNTSEVIPDDESEKPADFKNDSILDKLFHEIDRIDEEEKKRKKEEHPQWRYIQKNGRAIRFANVCAAHDIKTVGQLLNVGSSQFVNFQNMGRDCVETTSKALDNLYGIKAW